MRRLLALIAIAPLTAFASDPAPQPEPTALPQPATVAAPVPVQEPAATAAPVAKPGAAAAPAAVSAAETAAPAAAATAAAASDFNPPAGYRKKTFGDKTLYCRSDTPVGTRFAKEYCYSQTDLERKEASKRTLQQEVDRNRRTCAGGGCSGGGT
jgi:invasion protein IalB